MEIASEYYRRYGLLSSWLWSLIPDQGLARFGSYFRCHVHPCLFWCSACYAGMPSFAIVKDLDVLEERCSYLRQGMKACLVDHVGFERTKEAFHRRIVQAFALAAHRNCDGMKS